MKMTLTTKKDSTERHYFMNTTNMLENIRCEKDLGVLTDNKLNFDLHFAEKIKKADSMLAIIKKWLMKLNCQSLSVLIKTLLRPHLEYCNQAWRPHFQKHRSNLENAQRRATRLIPSLASLPYEQRLMKLDLPTLDFRKKRGRMIEVYKILNGVYDKRVTGGMLMEKTESQEEIKENLWCSHRELQQQEIFSLQEQPMTGIACQMMSRRQEPLTFLKRNWTTLREI